MPPKPYHVEFMSKRGLKSFNAINIPTIRKRQEVVPSAAAPTQQLSQRLKTVHRRIKRIRKVGEKLRLRDAGIAFNDLPRKTGRR